MSLQAGLLVTIIQASLLSTGMLIILTRKSPGIRHRVVIVALHLFAAAAAWGITIVSRSRIVYMHAATDERSGWEGRPFEADPVYGLVNSPGARAAERMESLPPVPVRFDANGFRIPMDFEAESPGSAGPLILFLGCSFTFGSGVPAESTFAWRVGGRIGGTALNAGVCSWGVAQMLLLAEELVPRYRPDAVVIQYSPWLVTRSSTGFAPVYFGILPVPYLAEAGEAGFVVADPPFLSTSIEQDPGAFIGGDAGAGGFAGFLFRLWGPQLVRDDIDLFLFRIAETIGSRPRRSNSLAMMARFSYSRLVTICEEHGAVPVILRLNGSQPDPGWDLVLECIPRTAVVVDGEEALMAALPQPDIDSYRRAYWHWGGDPPHVVNTHPNAAAHSIICDALCDGLARSAGSGSTGSCRTDTCTALP